VGKKARENGKNKSGENSLLCVCSKGEQTMNGFSEDEKYYSMFRF
jgi:hypothetical protein